MSKLENYIDFHFEKSIRAKVDIDGRGGDYQSYPVNLNEKLAEILMKQGVKELYSHQFEAFDNISNNKDTLLVSQTASGKTLSFFLPIFNEYLKADSPFTVLLLYPTKALSRDQEGTFGKLMQSIQKSGKLGTFDGDTPRDERDRIQRSVDFLITNPDMLHSGILPNHNRKWKSFLSRLRYIVIDEVHIYRGAFGSHVSNVFRRLLRICEIHGSRPAFVCSSATIGNPEEHVNCLFHRKFQIIQKDGAPKAPRKLYFINPPLVQSHGHAMYRKGPGSISIPLIREAAKNNIRTICFCRARQEVERLYRSVVDGNPELKSIIKPYRGGLLPNERRQLERDFLEGKIKVIISTNALELGIDIGDLELCILSGHPGTIASFWQQAGRVGRKGNSSVIVFIAKDSPIDQFLVHHPEFITSAPIEHALVNADNPYIFLQHLPCAAQEHPLRPTESCFDQMVYEEALKILKQGKTIIPYKEFYRYAEQDYPARGVNLRGMTDYNIEIICDSEVIGELDPIGARGTLYKDAIYHHLGKKYMSLDLDLEKKLCMIEPVDADYYTEAVWERRVDMIEIDDQREHLGASLNFGFIHVNKQPKLYKKIRERTYENIGYGPITLPPFEYDTTGFCFMAPKKWVQTMDAIDKRYTGAAYYGFSYLLRQSAPLLCMADIKDMDSDVSLVEEEDNNWKSALYLFDAIEGGVGYAERVHEKFDLCLDLCMDIILQCDCISGCPSCVPPLPPGVEGEELETFLVESNASVECTKSLLRYLIKNEVVLPNLKFTELQIIPPVEPPPQDIERIQTVQKLNRAAKILKNKREKLH